ncbi:UNVERIFIED_CONTAM: phosphatidylinositol 3- and 4-kinase [Hammondia hammondi]|eukprot:XP_008882203.1 phosphatidylinositol 3- and 4-kinase [Hammondia hammondi]
MHVDPSVSFSHAHFSFRPQSISRHLPLSRGFSSSCLERGSPAATGVRHVSDLSRSPSGGLSSPTAVGAGGACGDAGDSGPLPLAAAFRRSVSLHHRLGRDENDSIPADSAAAWNRQALSRRRVCEGGTSRGDTADPRETVRRRHLGDRTVGEAAAAAHALFSRSVYKRRLGDASGRAGVLVERLAQSRERRFTQDMPSSSSSFLPDEERGERPAFARERWRSFCTLPPTQESLDGMLALEEREEEEEERRVSLADVAALCQTPKKRLETGSVDWNSLPLIRGISVRDHRGTTLPSRLLSASRVVAPPRRRPGTPPSVGLQRQTAPEAGQRGDGWRRHSLCGAPFHDQSGAESAARPAFALSDDFVHADSGDRERDATHNILGFLREWTECSSAATRAGRLLSEALAPLPLNGTVSSPLSTPAVPRLRSPGSSPPGGVAPKEENLFLLRLLARWTGRLLGAAAAAAALAKALKTLKAREAPGEASGASLCGGALAHASDKKGQACRQDQEEREGRDGGATRASGSLLNAVSFSSYPKTAEVGKVCGTAACLSGCLRLGPVSRLGDDLLQHPFVSLLFALASLLSENAQPETLANDLLTFLFSQVFFASYQLDTYAPPCFSSFSPSTTSSSSSPSLCHFPFALPVAGEVQRDCMRGKRERAQLACTAAFPRFLQSCLQSDSGGRQRGILLLVLLELRELSFLFLAGVFARLPPPRTPGLRGTCGDRSARQLSLLGALPGGPAAVVETSEMMQKLVDRLHEIVQNADFLPRHGRTSGATSGETRRRVDERHPPHTFEHLTRERAHNPSSSDPSCASSSSASSSSLPSSSPSPSSYSPSIRLLERQVGGLGRAGAALGSRVWTWWVEGTFLRVVLAASLLPSLQLCLASLSSFSSSSVGTVSSAVCSSPSSSPPSSIAASPSSSSPCSSSPPASHAGPLSSVSSSASPQWGDARRVSLCGWPQVSREKTGEGKAAKWRRSVSGQEVAEAARREETACRGLVVSFIDSVVHLSRDIVRQQEGLEKQRDESHFPHRMRSSPLAHLLDASSLTLGRSLALTGRDALSSHCRPHFPQEGDSSDDEKHAFQHRCRLLSFAGLAVGGALFATDTNTWKADRFLRVSRGLGEKEERGEESEAPASLSAYGQRQFLSALLSSFAASSTAAAAAVPSEPSLQTDSGGERRQREEERRNHHEREGRRDATRARRSVACDQLVACGVVGILQGISACGPRSFVGTSADQRGEGEEREEHAVRGERDLLHAAHPRRAGKEERTLENSRRDAVDLVWTAVVEDMLIHSRCQVLSALLRSGCLPRSGDTVALLVFLLHLFEHQLFLLSRSLASSVFPSSSLPAPSSPLRLQHPGGRGGADAEAARPESEAEGDATREAESGHGEAEHHAKRTRGEVQGNLGEKAFKGSQSRPQIEQGGGIAASLSRLLSLYLRDSNRGGRVFEDLPGLLTCISSLLHTLFRDPKRFFFSPSSFFPCVSSLLRVLFFRLICLCSCDGWTCWPPSHSPAGRRLLAAASLEAARQKRNEDGRNGEAPRGGERTRNSRGLTEGHHQALHVALLLSRGRRGGVKEETQTVNGGEEAREKEERKGEDEAFQRINAHEAYETSCLLLRDFHSLLLPLLQYAGTERTGEEGSDLDGEELHREKEMLHLITLFHHSTFVVLAASLNATVRPSLSSASGEEEQDKKIDVRDGASAGAASACDLEAQDAGPETGKPGEGDDASDPLPPGVGWTSSVFSFLDRGKVEKHFSRHDGSSVSACRMLPSRRPQEGATRDASSRDVGLVGFSRSFHKTGRQREGDEVVPRSMLAERDEAREFRRLLATLAPARAQSLPVSFCPLSPSARQAAAFVVREQLLRLGRSLASAAARSPSSTRFSEMLHFRGEPTKFDAEGGGTQEVFGGWRSARRAARARSSANGKGSQGGGVRSGKRAKSSAPVELRDTEAVCRHAAAQIWLLVARERVAALLGAAGAAVPGGALRSWGHLSSQASSLALPPLSFFFSPAPARGSAPASAAKATDPPRETAWPASRAVRLRLLKRLNALSHEEGLLQLVACLSPWSLAVEDCRETQTKQEAEAEGEEEEGERGDEGEEKEEEVERKKERQERRACERKSGLREMLREMPQEEQLPLPVFIHVEGEDAAETECRREDALLFLNEILLAMLPAPARPFAADLPLAFLWVAVAAQQLFQRRTEHFCSCSVSAFAASLLGASRLALAHLDEAAFSSGSPQEWTRESLKKDPRVSLFHLQGKLAELAAERWFSRLERGSASASLAVGWPPKSAPAPCSSSSLSSPRSAVPSSFPSLSAMSAILLGEAEGQGQATGKGEGEPALVFATLMGVGQACRVLLQTLQNLVRLARAPWSLASTLWTLPVAFAFASRCSADCTSASTSVAFSGRRSPEGLARLMTTQKEIEARQHVVVSLLTRLFRVAPALLNSVEAVATLVQTIAVLGESLQLVAGAFEEAPVPRGDTKRRRQLLNDNSTVSPGFLSKATSYFLSGATTRLPISVSLFHQRTSSSATSASCGFSYSSGAAATDYAASALALAPPPLSCLSSPAVPSPSSMPPSFFPSPSPSFAASARPPRLDFSASDSASLALCRRLQSVRGASSSFSCGAESKRRRRRERGKKRGFLEAADRDLEEEEKLLGVLRASLLSLFSSLRLLVDRLGLAVWNECMQAKTREGDNVALLFSLLAILLSGESGETPREADVGLLGEVPPPAVYLALCGDEGHKGEQTNLQHFPPSSPGQLGTPLPTLPQYPFPSRPRFLSLQSRALLPFFKGTGEKKREEEPIAARPSNGSLASSGSPQASPTCEDSEGSPLPESLLLSLASSLPAQTSSRSNDEGTSAKGETGDGVVASSERAGGGGGGASSGSQAPIAGREARGTRRPFCPCACRRCSSFVPGLSGAEILREREPFFGGGSREAAAREEAAEETLREVKERGDMREELLFGDSSSPSSLCSHPSIVIFLPAALLAESAPSASNASEQRDAVASLVASRLSAASPTAHASSAPLSRQAPTDRGEKKAEKEERGEKEKGEKEHGREIASSWPSREEEEPSFLSVKQPRGDLPGNNVPLSLVTEKAGGNLETEGRREEKEGGDQSEAGKDERRREAPDRQDTSSDKTAATPFRESLRLVPLSGPSRFPTSRNPHLVYYLFKDGKSGVSTSSRNQAVRMLRVHFFAPSCRQRPSSPGPWVCRGLCLASLPPAIAGCVEEALAEFAGRAKRRREEARRIQEASVNFAVALLLQLLSAALVRGGRESTAHTPFDLLRVVQSYGAHMACVRQTMRETGEKRRGEKNREGRERGEEERERRRLTLNDHYHLTAAAWKKVPASGRTDRANGVMRSDSDEEEQEEQARANLVCDDWGRRVLSRSSPSLGDSQRENASLLFAGERGREEARERARGEKRGRLGRLPTDGKEGEEERSEAVRLHPERRKESSPLPAALSSVPALVDEFVLTTPPLASTSVFSREMLASVCWQVLLSHAPQLTSADSLFSVEKTSLNPLPCSPLSPVGSAAPWAASPASPRSSLPSCPARPPASDDAHTTPVAPVSSVSAAGFYSAAPPAVVAPAALAGTGLGLFFQTLLIKGVLAKRESSASCRSRENRLRLKGRPPFAFASSLHAQESLSVLRHLTALLRRASFSSLEKGGNNVARQARSGNQRSPEAGDFFSSSSEREHARRQDAWQRCIDDVSETLRVRASSLFSLFFPSSPSSSPREDTTQKGNRSQDAGRGVRGGEEAGRNPREEKDIAGELKQQTDEGLASVAGRQATHASQLSPEGDTHAEGHQGPASDVERGNDGGREEGTGRQVAYTVSANDTATSPRLPRFILQGKVHKPSFPEGENAEDFQHLFPQEKETCASPDHVRDLANFAFRLSPGETLLWLAAGAWTAAVTSLSSSDSSGLHTAFIDISPSSPSSSLSPSRSAPSRSLASTSDLVSVAVEALELVRAVSSISQEPGGLQLSLPVWLWLRLTCERASLPLSGFSSRDGRASVEPLPRPEDRDRRNRCLPVSAGSLGPDSGFERSCYLRGVDASVAREREALRGWLFGDTAFFASLLASTWRCMHAELLGQQAGLILDLETTESHLKGANPATLAAAVDDREVDLPSPFNVAAYWGSVGVTQASKGAFAHRVLPRLQAVHRDVLLASFFLSRLNPLPPLLLSFTQKGALFSPHASLSPIQDAQLAGTLYATLAAQRAAAGATVASVAAVVGSVRGREGRGKGRGARRPLNKVKTFFRSVLRRPSRLACATAFPDLFLFDASLVPREDTVHIESHPLVARGESGRENARARKRGPKSEGMLTPACDPSAGVSPFFSERSRRLLTPTVALLSQAETAFVCATTACTAVLLSSASLSQGFQGPPHNFLALLATRAHALRSWGSPLSEVAGQSSSSGSSHSPCAAQFLFLLLFESFRGPLSPLPSPYGARFASAALDEKIRLFFSPATPVSPLAPSSPVALSGDERDLWSRVSSGLAGRMRLASGGGRKEERLSNANEKARRTAERAMAFLWTPKVEICVPRASRSPLSPDIVTSLLLPLLPPTIAATHPHTLLRLGLWSSRKRRASSGNFKGFPSLDLSSRSFAAANERRASWALHARRGRKGDDDGIGGRRRRGEKAVRSKAERRDIDTSWGFASTMFGAHAPSLCASFLLSSFTGGRNAAARRLVADIFAACLEESGVRGEESFDEVACSAAEPYVLTGCSCRICFFLHSRQFIARAGIRTLLAFLTRPADELYLSECHCPLHLASSFSLFSPVAKEAFRGAGGFAENHEERGRTKEETSMMKDLHQPAIPASIVRFTAVHASPTQTSPSPTSSSPLSASPSRASPNSLLHSCFSSPCSRSLAFFARASRCMQERDDEDQLARRHFLLLSQALLLLFGGDTLTGQLAPAAPARSPQAAASLEARALKGPFVRKKEGGGDGRELVKKHARLHTTQGDSRGRGEGFEQCCRSRSELLSSVVARGLKPKVLSEKPVQRRPLFPAPTCLFHLPEWKDFQMRPRSQEASFASVLFPLPRRHRHQTEGQDAQGSLPDGGFSISPCFPSLSSPPVRLPVCLLHLFLQDEVERVRAWSAARSPLPQRVARRPSLLRAKPRGDKGESRKAERREKKATRTVSEGTCFGAKSRHQAASERVSESERSAHKDETNAEWQRRGDSDPRRGGRFGHKWKTQRKRGAGGKTRVGRLLLNRKTGHAGDSSLKSSDTQSTRLKSLRSRLPFALRHRRRRPSQTSRSLSVRVEESESAGEETKGETHTYRRRHRGVREGDKEREKRRDDDRRSTTLRRGDYSEFSLDWILQGADLSLIATAAHRFRWSPEVLRERWVSEKNFRQRTDGRNETFNFEGVSRSPQQELRLVFLSDVHFPSSLSNWICLSLSVSLFFCATLVICMHPCRCLSLYIYLASLKVDFFKGGSVCVATAHTRTRICQWL